MVRLAVLTTGVATPVAVTVTVTVQAPTIVGVTEKVLVVLATACDWPEQVVV